MLRRRGQQIPDRERSATPMGELLPPCSGCRCCCPGKCPNPMRAEKDRRASRRSSGLPRYGRGVVGVIDQYCPTASPISGSVATGMLHPLRLSRLEFDTAGAGVDSPRLIQISLPYLILIRSYPCREWAHDLGLYGARRARGAGTAGAEIALLPPSHRYFTKKWHGCNWVQALKASIDTAFHLRASVVRDEEKRSPRESRSTFVNR